MAKCQKCGKKGLFLKLNSDGYCKNCALIDLENKKNALENEIAGLKERSKAGEAQLSELRGKIAQESKALNEFQAKRSEVYNILKGQAETAALTKIKDQIDDLEAEKNEKESELKTLKTEAYALRIKTATTKTLYESYRSANKDYIKSGETNLGEIVFNKPTLEIDLQCFNVKQLRKLYNQNKNLIQDCLKRYEGRYTTKTNAALYKLMTIALEAELQNVLFSIKYGKLDSSVDSIKTMCRKYYVIATNGNQSIAPTINKFINEIERLFTEAVKIEYEYYVQKERIKEEQRSIREQMKQEMEERKALEQERKRIENEEQKYKNEIENIKKQLETADSKKAQILNDRISELENQINEVEDKREQILSLENGKAGYVYVISNIGSFGEDVYKIGMTRRLEPMDRINELGNASVPFPFDVHGLIFSDDAVSLEHDLHTVFNDRRVNKVNLRKEFFNVSLDDIEKVVDERCPSAEFKRTALAEQYRQSLTMSAAADELSDEEIKETIT